MSWFRAFRNDYGFTFYKDNRTPVTVDIPLVTVVYLCVVLASATLISTLGIRGRERWATTLRASYGVGIFSVLLVCLVGHNWLEGETEVMTHYLYRTDNYFRGTVGLRIALHGCNVTLSGYYEGPHSRGYVHYVETVDWKDYGHEQENLNVYLARGLPHPVLAVMDYLSVDSGGMRWGRNLHSAGYFANALLWSALVFWIISQVLLFSVVSYGSFMMLLTGAAMVLANIVYYVCQPPLDISFNLGEAVLTVRYGWCFWLSLAAGVLTLFLGLMLFIFDHFFHEKILELFNIDKLDEDDLGMSEYSSFNKAGSFVNNQTPEKVPPPFRHTGQHSRSSLSSLQSRRSSMQPMGSGRRNSIFLEPERRPSDFSNYRSGKNLGFNLTGSSLVHNSFPATSGAKSLSASNLAGGVTNKGFEQEMHRAKSNPLFAGSTSDIQEVAEDTPADETKCEDINEDKKDNKGTGEDRKGENTSTTAAASAAIPNRKPSLATMREHRENHMNERHQQQQQSWFPTSHSTVFINEDDNDNNSQSTVIVIHNTDDDVNGVTSAGDVSVTPQSGAENVVKDSGDDSNCLVDPLIKSRGTVEEEPEADN